MRSTLLAALSLGAVLLTGCDDEGDVIVAPDRPRASVRFINAVPDTVISDWRFIDQLPDTPYELGFAFRTMTDYQGAAPGTRPFRIFPGTDNEATQNALIAQDVTLTANTNYTFIHTGFTKPNQTPADQLLVITETVPTVPATDVAVRAMHLGAGMPDVDIYVTRDTGSAVPTIPAGSVTATSFADVTYGETTLYKNITRVASTGAVPLAATPTGYSRPTGSFATDGFLIGDQIFVSGFGTNANDGRARVTGITESKTTGATSLLATATGFERTTGSFVTDGFVANSWVTVSGFADPTNNGRFFIRGVTPTALLTGPTTGLATLGAAVVTSGTPAVTTRSYTRTTGSFVTDGFTVGMTVTASGFSGTNNGVATVAAVSALSLTVTKTPALVDDAPAAGRIISQNTRNAEVAAAERTITADAQLTVAKTPANAQATVGTRTIIGDLYFRAFAARAATPTVRDSLVAQWFAPPGDPANPGLNLQALGGATMGGSAILGLLVPRSVPGTGAPQTAATNSPPTPGFLVPTFIFAIDKHPR
jgi:hypothetical protein